MKSNKAGLTGIATVVLGTGASRAEACASRKRGVLPPLDADFFEQTPEAERTSHAGAMETLRTARELFGPLPNVGMETYFTQLEFGTALTCMQDIGKDLGRGDWIAARFPRAQASFLRALLEVLSAAGATADADALSPKLHGALVGVLERGDSLISFNYDVLIDSALKQEGNGKWDGTYGYHCRCSGVHDGVQHWQPRVLPPPRRIRSVCTNSTAPSTSRLSTWERSCRSRLSTP